MTVIAKAVDATVLQKATNGAANMDILADTRNTRTQAAHPAHNEVDLHTSLRCSVEQAHHIGVSEGVELEEQMTITIFFVQSDLAFDEIYKATSQPYWSNQQFAIR